MTSLRPCSIPTLPMPSALAPLKRRPLAGTRNELQARLDAFYRVHFVASAFNDRERNQLSMPHLIQVQQEYVDAPVRIMFVGQETTNWVGTLGQYLDEPESLERVQRAYGRLAKETKSTSALMRYRIELSRNTWAVSRRRLVGQTCCGWTGTKVVATGRMESLRGLR